MKKTLPIKESPGYYITDNGDVYSRRGSGRFRKLAPSKNMINDYLFVRLGHEKKKKYIHRLVYETFVGFSGDKKIINHKNGNKQDNRLENLEECDHTYNLIYAYYHGQRKLKPVVQLALNGRILNEYQTAKEAYEKTGVARSGICNCCKGKRLSSGGYQWKYKEKGEPKCTKCSET